MFTYWRLRHHITSTKPKTITIDVFDTLLLRHYKCEQWHFWQFSKSASQVLRKNKLQCSPLLYFSLRNYYNHLLRRTNATLGYGYEASLDSVNAEIIAEIARRKQQKISPDTITTICETLIQKELDFECKRLSVNTKLVKILSGTKLPIYFLTDMYFGSAQIVELFQKLGVNLTVNGVSSADHLVGKGGGQSFAKLKAKYPNIRFRANLHIGDHKHSDVRVPRSLGMEVFWLHLAWHQVELTITKYALGFAVKIIARRRMRQNYAQTKMQITHLLKAQNTHQRHRAKALGRVFGPAIVFYCHYFNMTAVTTNKTPLFVSSEAIALAHFSTLLGFKKPVTLQKFGRKLLLQAYCYQQRQAGVDYQSILVMVKKVQRRKSTYDALITLGIVDPLDNAYHLLGKKAFLEYLTKNQAKFSPQLKKSYTTVIRELRKATKGNNLATSLIGDVGWNTTIQILLSEVVKNAGFRNELSGIYLGLTGTNVFNGSIRTNSQGLIFHSLKGTSAYLYQPEVWESFLNTDNLGNSTRQAILQGIKTSCMEYQRSDLSPQDYYQQSRNLLIKVLAAPTKKIIQVFAGLQFDYGTGNEKPVPMVDITHSPIYVYRLLLRDRNQFKRFYHDQAWKWGAASWYHFRLLYRLWRLKTKKPSF